jgi:hypothetical protein
MLAGDCLNGVIDAPICQALTGFLTPLKEQLQALVQTLLAATQTTEIKECAHV